MGGIRETGVYIPAVSLTEGIIRRIKGERRISNFDEDTVTMGYESIQGISSEDVKELYFISSAFPFTIRSPAAFLATVLDREKEVKTFDVMGGSKSLIEVMGKASAGDSASLVILSEKRRYPVDTPEFYSCGHGAVAFLIDGREASVNVIGHFSISSDMLDEWKEDGERVIRTYEGKVTYELRKEVLRECINSLFAGTSITMKEVWKVIFPFSDGRTCVEAGSFCGFQKEQIHLPQLLSITGWMGSAHLFMEFVYLMETVEIPDEKYILLVGSGGGFSACLLMLKKNAKESVKRGVKECLKRKFEIKDLTLLYKITGDIEYEKVKPFSPVPLHYREIEECIKLKAQRCKRCGALQYPWRYVCYKCDFNEFEKVPLSKKGKIYTFTRDYLNPLPIQPLVMAVAELDGGVRFYGQMTDVNPAEVKIGMDVHLTLRRLHEGGEFTNYFWKMVPVQNR